MFLYPGTCMMCTHHLLDCAHSSFNLPSLSTVVPSSCIWMWMCSFYTRYTRSVCVSRFMESGYELLIPTGYDFFSCIVYRVPCIVYWHLNNLLGCMYTLNIRVCSVGARTRIMGRTQHTPAVLLKQTIHALPVHVWCFSIANIQNMPMFALQMIYE